MNFGRKIQPGPETTRDPLRESLQEQAIEHVSIFSLERDTHIYGFVEVEPMNAVVAIVEK